MSPLATSTGEPECDTIFNSDEQITYRIYCNATITGSTLVTTPSANLTICIGLCDSYGTMCFASIFYNNTAPGICVLKANDTTNASSKLKKRAEQLIYQDNAFVALRLADPAVEQGPPAPAAPGMYIPGS